ncbi:hypothetical protein H8356DRAFT_1333009 [Neocallimastix lanati (nom. inval.)]|nr:hypothetical protein H8356DRAFT_1333009 [Neocallimastix sp. JGI-2020a]
MVMMNMMKINENKGSGGATKKIEKIKENNNNLDTHNECPSPMMTITNITVKCDILVY